MNASLANFARNRFVYELASHRIRVETASETPGVRSNRVGNTGKKYGIRVGSALKAREIEEDPRWMRAICA